MKDLLEKYLTTVLSALTLAIIGNAIVMWQSVHDLEVWKSTARPLEEAVQAAQLQAQITSTDQRSRSTESAVDRLSNDTEMKLSMLQSTITSMQIQLARSNR